MGGARHSLEPSGLARELSSILEVKLKAGTGQKEDSDTRSRICRSVSKSSGFIWPAIVVDPQCQTYLCLSLLEFKFRLFE